MKKKCGDAMNYPYRKKNRLPEFDYSRAGYYFVTICSKNKAHIFGKVCVGPALSWPPASVQLSPIGKCIERAILSIPQKYADVYVDKYVIMPNHVHMILILDPADGQIRSGPTLSNIVGQTKRKASKEACTAIWQHSFHDHIIRSEADYHRIWQYIDTNPVTWQKDCYYSP